MSDELKKRKNRGLIIFLLIILLIALASVGYFTYVMINNGNSSNDEFNFILTVYKDDKGKLCLTENDTCSNTAYSIKTKTSDSKVLSVDSDNLFVLYNDNGLKIYNTSTSLSNEVNLENYYTDYKIYTTNEKDQVSAVIYQDGDYAGYYNVLTSEKLFENKYHLFEYRDEFYVEGRIEIPEERDARIELLNLKNKNIILSNTMNEKGYINSYYIKKFNSNYYIYELCHCDVPGVSFYTEDGKKIASTYISYEFSDTGNLYTVVDNKIQTYDINGNLLKTSKEYNEILILEKNYVIYLTEDNRLNIDDFENNKTINTYKLNDKYKTYRLHNTSLENQYILFGCIDENYDGYYCSEGVSYKLDLNTLNLTEEKNS